MFKALIGDLFASQAQTLVNTVNCVGVMGKGVALEFKKRFPRMARDYADRCARGEVRLGEPYLYTDETGARIVNFPTKGHWRSSSRLADIDRGLDYLAAHAAEWGITSLALPPLGCGNGGLAWSEVGPLIHAKLHELPIDVEVYAPYGTPKSELTAEFLAAPSQLSLTGRGIRAEKPNPSWIALVEVLRELQAQPYANPVGRTIFQKIAYVLTEMRVPTGFEFGKGSYGPFSGDMKAALHDFANRNWLQEAQLGKMIAFRVSPQYEKDRRKLGPEIELHRKKIDKTADLFSRIKSTEQAEEVATIIYACRWIKARRPGSTVSEQNILDYVLDWKPSWRSEEKREAVAGAIRNLVLLNWVKAEISEAMIEAA
ncbi:macro domain-containing protein [Sphingomonas cannabina]|uniref:type II toxin-antitoxin system antitoxin DNA ADP-ribosyl glycohydrolase DarG n=1 Tax=Sphingomonas cannabina TaxID=2899123 RepID=UPI001F344A6B|nr:macro domain-containing protein [Sphingomonas cannabina]UIJ46245.1 macro domain-containing protein [Sphingomonas cannabina]